MPSKRRVQSGVTRGTVFKEVARVRLEDGGVLLENKRYSGAIYLAGYALECLLKWAVTQYRQCVYLPSELETHDLEQLLAESGLRSAITRRRDLAAFFVDFAKTWGPDLRYLAKEPSANRANLLYLHLVKTYRWIDEQR